MGADVAIGYRAAGAASQALIDEIAQSGGKARGVAGDIAGPTKRLSGRKGPKAYDRIDESALDVNSPAFATSMRRLHAAQLIADVVAQGFFRNCVQPETSNS